MNNSHYRVNLGDEPLQKNTDTSQHPNLKHDDLWLVCVMVEMVAPR